jgi:hypothetical protein
MVFEKYKRIEIAWNKYFISSTGIRALSINNAPSIKQIQFSTN